MLRCCSYLLAGQLRDAALGFRGRPHLHKAHLQPVPQLCPIMHLARVILPVSVLSTVISMPLAVHVQAQKLQRWTQA